MSAGHKRGVSGTTELCIAIMSCERGADVQQTPHKSGVPRPRPLDCRQLPELGLRATRSPAPIVFEPHASMFTVRCVQAAQP